MQHSMIRYAKRGSFQYNLDRKYSYRKNVEKALAGRLSRDKDLEVLVYIDANKSSRSYYGYYNSIVVEAVLGSSSIKTEISKISPWDNGSGGSNVTGAALLSLRTVIKVLTRLGVPPSQIVDCGVVEG